MKDFDYKSWKRFRYRMLLVTAFGPKHYSARMTYLARHVC